MKSDIGFVSTLLFVVVLMLSGRVTCRSDVPMAHT